MRYLASYVQRPTSAPTPSDLTVGTFEVAHQRQNKSGGFSQAQTVSGVSLPNTITIQGYTDPAELLSDRVLVRQAGSATWKEVPGVTGQTVDLPASIPGSWVTVSNEELADNQGLTTLDGLDFGTFSAAAEPERTVYVLNDGTDTIQSMTLGVRSNSGELLELLDNRLQLDILGTLGSEGLGALTTTFNGSIVFGLQARNTLPIITGPGQVVKLRFTLVNFPATGLPSTAVSAEIILQPNATRSSAPVWLDWPINTLQADETYSYLDLVVEDPASTGIIVNPYALRLAGSVVFRDLPTEFPISDGAGRYRVAVSSTGQTTVGLVSDPLGERTEIYQFDWAAGSVSNGLPSVGAKSVTSWLTPDAALAPHRFVSRSGGGLVNGPTDVLGIATDELGNYVALGYALLEVSENVQAGDRLNATATGRGQIAADGPARALLPGQTGDNVPVFMSVTAVSSSNGVTDLSVSRGSSSVTVASSTGTDAALFGATTSQAGVLTAADKTKLDGIETAATANSTDAVLLDRASHTGQQLPSTIFGFAETVQDTVATLITDGTGINSTYDDGAATLTLDVSADLAVAQATNEVTIANPLGNDAIITAATASAAGVLTSTDKTKLDSVETGATQNSTDSFLLSRANHTGTQPQSTIEGLGATFDGKLIRQHGFIQSVPGVAVSIPGTTWIDPEGAGYATATTVTLTSGVTRSGKWGITIPAGLYLVCMGGYVIFPNSTTNRVLLGMNQGTYRLFDLVNSNSVFNPDNQFNYTMVALLGAGTYKPSMYVDVNAGPVNLTFRTFGLIRLG